MESEFKEAPLGGTLHAWTVSAPYIVALVDMDAGVRVNAQLHGVPESALKIGLRVKLGFEPVNKEVTLPVFVAE
ncbi:hypothetical protein OSTOST_13167 [Ostertagia ostertagi]